MKLNIFSSYKFNIDSTEAFFYRIKINSHVIDFTKKKKGRKVSFKYKKRVCITVNSHLNSSKTNNSNKSNSHNVIGNSNLHLINVHNESSLNKLITVPKKKIQSQLLVLIMK